jgi:hypothetical protein
MKTNQDTISEKYKIALQEAEKRGYDRCLAEQKFSKPCTDKFDELLEKRAYANGFKEGEIKGLSESITVKGKSHLSYYQQGYALGQSDLKAKLLDPELKEILRKRHHCPKNNYGIQMMLEEALAEATKGEKVF